MLTWRSRLAFVCHVIPLTLVMLRYKPQGQRSVQVGMQFL